ncbi:MAG: hypothetical protein JKY56_19750 [Kofleriaceae bacterium]|nr:hypothetical protein [Kofleriaceae bacterium]
MSSKKSKTVVAETTTPTFPLTSALWENLWALADDSRGEVHKQTAALIGFVDGLFQGATKFATNLNDRADALSQLSITSANANGRTAVASLLAASQATLTSYRTNSMQLVSSTRDSARNIGTKASATAQVLFASAPKSKKAA